MRAQESSHLKQTDVDKVELGHKKGETASLCVWL